MMCVCVRLFDCAFACVLCCMCAYACESSWCSAVLDDVFVLLRCCIGRLACCAVVLLCGGVLLVRCVVLVSLQCCSVSVFVH